MHFFWEARILIKNVHLEALLYLEDHKSELSQKNIFSLHQQAMVFSDMVSNPDMASIWSTKKSNLENCPLFSLHFYFL